jgi:hypothetical protein
MMLKRLYLSYRVAGVQGLCGHLRPLSHWHICVTRHGGGDGCVCFVGWRIRLVVVVAGVNVASHSSAFRRFLALCSFPATNTINTFPSGTKLDRTYQRSKQDGTDARDTLKTIHKHLPKNIPVAFTSSFTTHTSTS